MTRVNDGFKAGGGILLIMHSVAFWADCAGRASIRSIKVEMAIYIQVLGIQMYVCVSGKGIGFSKQSRLRDWLAYGPVPVLGPSEH